MMQRRAFYTPKVDNVETGNISPAERKSIFRLNTKRAYLNLPVVRNILSINADKLRRPRGSNFRPLSL